MKILVTGGAGFIGSAVIRNLINCNNNHICNIDKLTYAANLSALKVAEQTGRLETKVLDICDFLALKSCFFTFKPDIVMHLAAETHVDNSIVSPRAFVNTNIIGTFNLLEVARKYFTDLTSGAKEKFKFIHVSTDEVYGSLGKNGFFSESSPYDPSSPYSASKASSDHLVRAWYRTYGLPTIVTNCSNNYGPFQFVEKFIPKVINRALNGQEIPIYGDGRQVRDWLFVEDHADALLSVLKEGKPGETYNIGGNAERTNLEVALKICSVLDKEKPNKSIKYSSFIKHVKDRLGHDQRYAIDARKIRKQLNWSPSYGFDDGIYKTVLWYIKHEKIV